MKILATILNDPTTIKIGDYVIYNDQWIGAVKTGILINGNRFLHVQGEHEKITAKASSFKKTVKP